MILETKIEPSKPLLHHPTRWSNGSNTLHPTMLEDVGKKIPSNIVEVGAQTDPTGFVQHSRVILETKIEPSKPFQHPTSCSNGHNTLCSTMLEDVGKGNPVQHPRKYSNRSNMLCPRMLGDVGPTCLIHLMKPSKMLHYVTGRIGLSISTQ